MSKKDTKADYSTISLQVVYQSNDTVPNKLFCFQEEPTGFVPVVKYGEDFIVPGYSPECKFDYATINPGLKELLIQYEQAPTTPIQNKRAKL